MWLGHAETLFSPLCPVALTGYAERDRPAEAIADPLSCGVAVFGGGPDPSGGVEFLLVSLDVLHVPRKCAESWARELELSQGIPADRIVFAASHTHSAPPLGRLPLLPAADERFAAQVREVVLSTVDKALQSRFPNIEVAYAEGLNQQVGRSRLKTAGFPRLILLACRSRGRVRLLIVHYNCHPTVLPPSFNRISSDFVGPLRQKLSRLAADAQVMFVNGAAGDISTRFTRKGRDESELDRMADILARHGDLLLQGAEFTPLTQLRHRFEQLSFPLRQRDSEEILLRREGELRRSLQCSPLSSGDRRTLEVQLQGIMVDLASRKSDISLEHDFALHTCQFGESCALAFLPGEPSSLLAERLRLCTPTPVCLVGYSNGYPGYLLPEEQLQQRDGYEARSTHFEPGTAEILTDRLARMLSDRS